MSNSIMNLKEFPSVEVHCNWDSNIPEKSIHDSVLLTLDDKDSSEVHNLNDIVNVKTTVSFIVPERHMEKPLVVFQIAPQESLYISSVTLLCDSKAIEVFGDHSIYLDTFYGTAIEETDEFYVYEYKVDLNKKINKEISLKFVKLARSNCLWIYGILLKLKKINHSPNVSSINYDNVQDLLKNAQISEQANKVFSFLRDSNMGRASGEGSLSKPYDGAQPQLSEIKQYIDYKFQILMDYLIMRERSMNDKLDRIIEIMKSKN